MCFHKYTHYLKCKTHVPLHTHVCPKNIHEDISRVIFCENYKTTREDKDEPCPFCLVPEKTQRLNDRKVAPSKSDAYPSPARTVTP